MLGCRRHPHEVWWSAPGLLVLVYGMHTAKLGFLELCLVRLACTNNEQNLTPSCDQQVGLQHAVNLAGAATPQKLAVCFWRKHTACLSVYQLQPNQQRTGAQGCGHMLKCRLRQELIRGSYTRNSGKAQLT